MSCFVVSDNHINFILSGVKRYDFRYGTVRWNGHTLAKIESALDAAGKAMLEVNLRAYAERYGDTTEEEIQERVAAFKFRFFDNIPLGGLSKAEAKKAIIEEKRPASEVVASVTQMNVLKLIDGFEYQASDLTGYGETEVAKLMRVIRKAMIQTMPGYEDAPWAL